MLEDRAERRPELVAHVREEPALQVGGIPQPVGVVVELGVERQDAPIGLGQLGRQRVDLRLESGDLLPQVRNGLSHEKRPPAAG